MLHTHSHGDGQSVGQAGATNGGNWRQHAARGFQDSPVPDLAENLVYFNGPLFTPPHTH